MLDRPSCVVADLPPRCHPQDGWEIGEAETLAACRRLATTPDFLEEAATRALRWMDYQSPSNQAMVAQQPTSDWRDEQWVLGFGLYVNALVHTYLKLFGRDDRADILRTELNHPVNRGDSTPAVDHEGLSLSPGPCYALWSCKLYFSERFDLLGNSMAILSGVATRKRANAIVDWIESSCSAMRDEGLLSLDLPPNLFPFIQPTDADWRDRYATFNRPGEYHNGGIWPFVCGVYIAALVAAGRQDLAEKKLVAFTALVRRSKNPDLRFGFNEWIRAQDGIVRGEDWQTWSAAMYLYAASCVETGTTPIFDVARGRSW